MKTNARSKVKNRLKPILGNSVKESHVGTTCANVSSFVLMDLFTIELLLHWPKVKLFLKKSTSSFFRISTHILKQAIKYYKEDQFTLCLMGKSL